MRKHAICFTLCAIFGAGSIFALPQENNVGQTQEQSAAPEIRAHPDPSRQAKLLGKRLNLTPDQQSQVLSILNDRAQRIETLHSDQSTPSQDRHAEMRKIRQDTESRMQAVLTPEQKQQWDSMQQQARERARERRSGTAGSQSDPH